MKHLLSIEELGKEEIFRIFSIADEVPTGKYNHSLAGKSIVLFFPDTSIRTRVTFEKGIHLLGGQSILFPTEALNKKESLEDVCGYLNQWADAIIVRHSDCNVLKEMMEYSTVPVINAMTSENHPCEILSDLYSLSRIRTDFTKDKFLFCGRAGNIGNSWKNASRILGFPLSQCCAKGYEMDGIPVFYKIQEAIRDKDIICTDSLPAELLEEFADCRVTRSVLDMANKGAVLNPCPPFYRGEEIAADAIASDYFVGYSFKKCLLEVQQAIILHCCGIL